MWISENFENGLDERWQISEVGRGIVTPQAGQVVLENPAADETTYHNAQIADYVPPQFGNKPPLRLTVRARAEGMIRGTAGFGFWNHPFVPGERGFRLPQAAWFFFASQPSNMALALDVPGQGWKAATFDAKRWQFLALLPAAPLGFLLMRVPGLYRALWGNIGQRAIGVREHALDAALLADWHTYTLEWYTDGVRFFVDDVAVYEADDAPRGALGFLAWVDNQYAIVTPQGQFGSGLVDVPQTQRLRLHSVTISPLG